MQQASKLIQFCKAFFLLSDISAVSDAAAVGAWHWGKQGVRRFFAKARSDWGVQVLVILGTGLLLHLFTTLLYGVTDNQCHYWCIGYGTILNLGVVALSLRAAHQFAHSETRVFWRLLAAGFSITAISDTIRLYSALVKDAPSSLAFVDPLYILTYITILVALLYYARVFRSPSTRVRFGLDLGIIFLGTLMVTWYFVIYPIFLQLHDDMLMAFLPLLYPALDIMLIFGGSILARRQPDPRTQWPFQLLILGGIVMLISDLLLATQELTGNGVNDWIFVLSDSSKFIMALGAQLQFRTVTQRVLYPRQPYPWEKTLYKFLPYLAVIAGYSVVLFSVSFSNVGSIPWLTIGATILTSLIMIRQMFVLRENAQEMQATLRLTEELRRSEARFRSLVQNASDVITVVGANGKILYESPALLPILGYQPDARLEQSIFDFIHPLDGAQLPREGDDCFFDAPLTLELRMLHADGSWLWIEAKLTNLLHDPDIDGIVANYRDIRERKRFEEQLRHLAYHDPLTNVANRTLFHERLSIVFAAARESGNLIAVFLIDLDGFKRVNDQYGHSVGDQLLIMVGQRICSCLRKGDLVARLGGDEFAILLDQLRTTADAVKVAERIIQSLDSPLQIEDQELIVKGSIGIALHQPGIDSADLLLRNADRAMYLAKSHGKGCYALFAPSEAHSLV